jgi:polo-like kinase 1
VSAGGQLTCFKISAQPSDRELSKKLTLIQYFSKYLNGGQSVTDEGVKPPPLCYIKKWIKSDKGILFRLSNKVLQINFVDKSQIVVYTQKNVGVYSGGALGNQKVFFEIGSA